MQFFCNVTDETTGEVSVEEFMGLDGDCVNLNDAENAKTVKLKQVTFDKPEVERAKLVYLAAATKADRAFVAELKRSENVGNRAVRRELQRSIYLDHYEKKDKFVKAFIIVLQNTK